MTSPGADMSAPQCQDEIACLAGHSTDTLEFQYVKTRLALKDRRSR